EQGLLGNSPEEGVLRTETQKGVEGGIVSLEYDYMKKGSTNGISMVLTDYVLLKNCIPYKEFKLEWRQKYHIEMEIPQITFPF
uniref:Uncharacterized protein n=1 Tax=Monodelphis domestica TaxID=13616 RepID=A0A5F8G7T1_MONDO